MATPVKRTTRGTLQRQPPRRGYDATRRRAAAQATRQAIAAAARRLFLERGYTATTMAAIARAAGVSHETVYAAFGPKAALFRHLVETALSGTDEPVAPLERDYARQVLAETDPRCLFALYARAMRLTQERLAPLFDVLGAAARTEPELKALADELSARRVRVMRLLATHLAAIGGLRPGVSVDAAADLLWLLNASDVYLLLVRERGWSPDAFEQWLAETWTRLLVPEPLPAP
jgi:AcrR family transcriptional regulator